MILCNFFHRENRLLLRILMLMIHALGGKRFTQRVEALMRINRCKVNRVGLHVIVVVFLDIS